jgi:hypothetical protein
MAPSTTTRIIEEFIRAQEGGAGADARHRYLMRQFMHSLVRQARAELLLEMRGNARRLAGWSMDGTGWQHQGAARQLPCDEGGAGD